MDITSGNYKVISNGTVIAFDENADITFYLSGEEVLNFDFILKLKFLNDENQPQTIIRNIKKTTIELKCLNFFNAGTGTSSPIRLVQVGTKKIYFSFWGYLEGDMTGKRKTRKVDYTFFVGE